MNTMRDYTETSEPSGCIQQIQIQKSVQFWLLKTKLPLVQVTLALTEQIL